MGFDELINRVSVSPKSSPEGGLFLLRLDAIGDFVVWLDAAEGIRRHYENTEITLVGNALWTDLAKRLPYFDRVISVMPHRFRHNLSYRCRILRALSRTTYQAAFHLAHRRKGRFADAEAILRYIRAKKKVASKGDVPEAWRRRWSDRWYTDTLPISQSAMELRRNASFVRQIGPEDFQAGLPTLPTNCLPTVPGELPDTYYVLFPGAGSERRKWGCARFARIADRMYEETGWTGIICGGPGEENLGKKIKSLTEATLENHIGGTTLSELAAVIAGAQVLIGNETSAVHLATAVATPSVCVLGGGHYGRFVPYETEEENPNRPVPRPVINKMPCFQCDWDCCFDIGSKATAPCVDRITVEAVWEQTHAVLRSIQSG